MDRIRVDRLYQMVREPHIPGPAARAINRLSIREVAFRKRKIVGFQDIHPGFFIVSLCHKKEMQPKADGLENPCRTRKRICLTPRVDSYHRYIPFGPISFMFHKR